MTTSGAGSLGKNATDLTMVQDGADMNIADRKKGVSLGVSVSIQLIERLFGFGEITLPISALSM